MDTEDKKFYDREMEKLERQQKGLRDNYNQEIQEFDEHQYIRQLRVAQNQEYAYQSGESLERFLLKLEVHAETIMGNNIRLHMKGPKGPWYSHRRPDGCFMCKDVELIGYLMNIIRYFVQQNPKSKINL